MANITPSMLRKAVAAQPQTSLQDGLLIFCVMLVALLLAIQYDLFYFIDDLSSAQRHISLAEAIFLTLPLATSLVIFTLRRLRNQSQDMATRTAAEFELRELMTLAMQDPLTGLLNRRALLTALAASTETAAKAIAASPTAKVPSDALFMIDLSDFKNVNDNYGHAVGDQVLEIVGNRFQSAARPSDLVSRIGGDEFAVLAYNVDREAAHKIGSRFLESLTSHIQAGGQIHQIAMAIGVTLIPDDSATAEDALRHADLAMYRAKELDRTLMFFEPAVAQKQIV